MYISEQKCPQSAFNHPIGMKKVLNTAVTYIKDIICIWYMPHIPFLFAVNTFDICGKYEIYMAYPL